MDGSSKGNNNSASSSDDENVVVSEIVTQENVEVSNVVTQPVPMSQIMPANASENVNDDVEVTLPEPTTNNGLMTELQNILSVVCYHQVNQKTLKMIN